MRNPPVREIMATELETIRAGTKLSEARHHFFSGLFHHLPVVGPNGLLVGLLSHTDLRSLNPSLLGVEDARFDAFLDGRFTLADVMQTELVTIHPDEPVSRAADLLSEGTFHALPVVDRRGRLQGLLTTTDLVVFLRRNLR
jgi:CBS-domain-containing membrane protein